MSLITYVMLHRCCIWCESICTHTEFFYHFWWGKRDR